MTELPKDSGKKEPSELSDIRVRRDSPITGARDAFLELRDALCRQLLATWENPDDLADRSRVRLYVHDRLDGLLEERVIVLNRGEKRQLLEAIVAELSGSRS